MKIVLMMVLLFSLFAFGDAFAGPPKLDSCIDCHGLVGGVRDLGIPNTVGQSKTVLLKRTGIFIASHH